MKYSMEYVVNQNVQSKCVFILRFKFVYNKYMQ